MRTPLLAAAVAGLLACALPAGAAPARPQITDPAGDALPVGGAGYDVVSALFRTERSSRLVITITYAGPVPTDPLAAQVVRFTAGDCGPVYLENYTDGPYGLARCVPDEFGFSVQASGRTLTFTVPFSAVGRGHLRKGALLTDLRTYTSYAAPLSGYETGELSGRDDLGPVDNAATSTAYRMG